MSTSPVEILGIDFESASFLDIKLGNSAYAEHPTTKALCGAFTFRRKQRGKIVYEDHLWEPGEPLPRGVAEWISAGYPVLAHNIAMEHEMIKAGHIHGCPVPDISQWHDTMALGAAANLPQGLEGLCEALGVPVQKDSEGHKLMLRLCKLDEEGNHLNPPRPGEIERLKQYNVVDNHAMFAAYEVLPPLIEAERKTWEADTRQNERGVYVDIHYVKALADMATAQKKALRAASHRDTAFLVDNVVADAKEFVKASGIALPRRKRANGKWSESLDSAACEELLERGDELPPAVAGVLRRKIEAGRLTSLSKLKAVPSMRSRDARIRWQLRYCGASQTGRWSAKGMQLHNVPKDRRKRPHSELVRLLVETGDLRLLSYCEPNVLKALSLCLRSMIAAPPGYDLIGSDYSAIEARVLPWLAFDDRKLKVFESGADIYVLSAAAVGSTVRDLGKVQELALQFGMGPLKFADTALDYGVELELKEARRIQRLWRDRNPLTVELWKTLEDTARNLIRGKPGRQAAAGRCTLRRMADRLLIELPSGRALNYWHPRIVPTVKKIPTVDESGAVVELEMETEAIQFWGPRGKKMVVKETYGGKLAENVTQGTARDLLGHALNVVESHPTYTSVLHLHDAACSEVRTGDGDPDEFSGLISDLPPWACGLPVDAEGYRSPVFLG